ncbi:hypothetical protein IFM89_017947 [Coptis chinensis]|uniref:RRM domain-containing protein n=1 Tax=Coptis chinensis TaxID=261450 RepID=A0A835LWB0_9MAGN|nr:hypothetical protein IFM89_017947 [Coptis chinensis]
MAYQSIPGPSSSSSSFHLFNSTFGDTTYTKVFVGGLAWETQSKTMCRYFDQFRDILEAVVITDRITGRSKGYGFVTFRDPEAAKRACLDPSPVIDGRRRNELQFGFTWTTSPSTALCAFEGNNPLLCKWAKLEALHWMPQLSPATLTTTNKGLHTLSMGE